MTASRLAAAHCTACAIKEQQIRDLRLVISKLQAAALKRLGPTSAGIIRTLDTSDRPMTPAEIAKAMKGKLDSVGMTCRKLAKQGILRRAGWRDIPGARWPAPEYVLVAARDGAPHSRDNGTHRSRPCP